VAFAGFALVLITLARTLGPDDGVLSPFVGALPQECWASSPAANMVFLAATGIHRGDAAVALNLVSRFLTVPLASQRRGQSGRDHWPQSGERLQKCVFRMLFG
jgi:hypothetical protein